MKKKIIVGVDEAGRGPLAGRVYAAAVLLGDNNIKGIADSKKLSEKKREELFPMIISQAVAYGIGYASPEEIDFLNILQATFLAMKRAVDQISLPFEYLLVDGNIYPPSFQTLPPRVQGRAIIKGDSKIEEIMAASILAKVSRDHHMQEMAFKYPNYQFEKHKGYPTPLHKNLIKQFGPCEIHRKTFRGVKEYLPE